jgi:hypothetical protein
MTKAEHYANRLNDLISEVNKLRHEIFAENMSDDAIDTEMLIARAVGGLQKAVVAVKNSDFRD